MGAIANAGAPPANIPFTSLPASQPLSGAASTAGAGVIDGYEWTIVSKPAGSAAALSSSTVVAPTLNTIDIAGTYFLALNVHDSVDGWAWDSDPASGDLQNLPTTMPSALICINAEMNYTSLVPIALGERTTPDLTSAEAGYMDAWGKWVDLFGVVDGLQGQVDAIGSTPTFDSIFVDEINEKTAAHGIYLNDDVYCWEDLTVATGKGIVANSLAAHLSATLTIAAGNDLDLSATADLTIGGATVVLTAGAAQSVVARGGPLYPDLAVNVIGEDSAGVGVTVDSVLLKDGDVTTATSTDKVKTNLIEAGSVAGGSTTLAISAATEVTLAGAGAGVTVESVNFDGTTIVGATVFNSPAASAMSVFADDTMTVGSTNKAKLQSNSGDAEIKATAGSVLVTATAGTITGTAGNDIFFTATDDFGFSGGGGTVGVGIDGGTETILITAVNGVNFSGPIETPSGALAIVPASGIVNVTGVVYSNNQKTMLFPLAVTPAGDYTPALIETSYSGEILSAVFTAAVAATSAGGDITVGIYNGDDDAELAAPVSLDGVTTPTSLTIGTAAFSGGFYPLVHSTNGDAIQGYGIVLNVVYKTTGSA